MYWNILKIYWQSQAYRNTVYCTGECTGLYSLNLIPIWEWTWLYWILCVGGLKCIFFFQLENICPSKKRCCWNANVYVEIRHTITSMFEVGESLYMFNTNDTNKVYIITCYISTNVQGLRASSLQFTSQLEFNAIFRDGFTLRHELTAGSKIRDPVPAKFKHVTNIVICPLLCCDYVTYVPALKFPKSWLWTLGYRPKIHHFFFSHKWGTCFKYLSKLCPYILMYSALHIMQ